ncbi:MAG: hypothetical protein WC589_21985 [Sphingobacterium sp.]
MRIDTHQHFWKFDPIRDSWITEEMQVIRRDFSPLDIQFVLERNGLEGVLLFRQINPKKRLLIWFSWLMIILLLKAL